MDKLNFQLNIDIELLRQQKAALLSIQDSFESFNDELTGILNLFDEIQDQLILIHRLPEHLVFNI